MIKRISVMILILLLMTNLSVFGEDEWLDDQETEDVFSDVNREDPYYEAVMTMHRYGIISGYEDGTFRPENLVTREEFATMMVRALQLDIIFSPSSFHDVADGYWASEYIETAKSYLTGFVKQGEYFFKPTDMAVREDMAVALVRALNKPLPADLTSLSTFADASEINSNLKIYVASAIENNLMMGQEENGEIKFNPLQSLTRSETAALLLKIVQDEKIVFEEEPNVSEPSEDDEIQLIVDVIEGGLELTWEHNIDGLEDFRVIASKEDSNLSYDENGSVRLTKGHTTKIYHGDINNKSDFSSFVELESYYFAVAAKVNDKVYISNVVQGTLPEAVNRNEKTPVVSITEIETGLRVKWEPVIVEGLLGYEVVASKSDETPTYPDSGYAKWITNLNELYFDVSDGTRYFGGDIGQSFKSGETYYFSVTAVYGDGKFTGNSVQYQMPGDLEVITIEEKTPEITVEVVNNHLVVRWNDISLTELEGYKIVASKNNESPVYPDDGYAFYITDLNVREKDILNGSPYSGGDFGGEFVGGETYNIMVVAIYSTEFVPSNVVQIKMPE